MFDYYEKEWTMEDLTKEEMTILTTEWEKLDDYDKTYYDDFEEFCEDYILKICYPEI